jgi:protein-L-isoaspartate O-methyltransferase
MSTSRNPALAAPAPGRQSAYGEHARSYGRDTAAFQPYRRAVVEALPLRRGQVVLDVGCGTGLCCGLLRDKVGPRGGVVGIEESPEMVALAREHIACEGWGNVTVVHAPAEDAHIGLTADPLFSVPSTTSCNPRVRCGTS